MKGVKELLQILADIPIDHMSNGSVTLSNARDSFPIMTWVSKDGEVNITVGNVKEARRLLAKGKFK